MGVFSSSSRFDPTRDLPSQAGKVALVSGANAGIGYFTALNLALKGATVYVGARDERKGLAAIAEMEDQHPELRGEKRLRYVHLDLSTVKGVKKDALAFLEIETRLDILVNNAGVGDSTYTMGPEGVEQAFVTNLLGGFVITTTLLPLLRQTAAAPDSDVRVVTLASDAHRIFKGTPMFESIDDFNSTWTSNPKSANTFLNRTSRYGMSKLADILFAKELQRRFVEEDVNIISTSLHPGFVRTPGLLKIFAFAKWILPLISITPDQGSYASLFAAAAPIVKQKPEVYRGAYFESFGTLATPTAVAQDPERAKNLWRTSEKVVDDILAR